MIKKKQSRTCIIVARNRAGKIMMAADRLASYDWGHAELMERPKIKKSEGVLIGASGDGGLCYLLVDVMEIPTVETNDGDKYINFIFKKQIFKTLKQNGYVDEHGILRIPTDVVCILFVVVLGIVYRIGIYNPDPEVTERTNGEINIDPVAVPNAIGCGDMPAIISLKKDLKKTGYNTREHLIEAIEIACEVSPGCGLIKNQKPDILVED